MPGFSLATKTGRPSKHPWKEWCSGKVIRLRQGKDFHCSVAGMCSTIRSHCSRHNLFVHIRVCEQTSQIEFLATPSERKYLKWKR